jgi:hypothetical protein
LTDVGLALERYSLLAEQGIELTAAREKWLRATLIRRILSDQRDFLRVAQRHIGISEFGDIMNRVIYPPNSHGRLGGKGAGLLLASQIILSAVSSDSLLSNVKIPKTWYLTSDNLFYFMSYNGLEDTIEQKYKELGQVRLEYPYIMHLFKRSPLPPETVKGLSLALDDFGDVPLIVRSSSLLEDRGEASFAGKYKSLFIANKGTKEERLSDLMDAVSEVLASTFGPDPIEYRTQRGLVDQQEGMGIMIQQVVGAPVGQYYLPAFAGVAFSRNQFRWSSRLKAEDGLVRLVPGLGTRAVDRLIDDYPILVAPGQPHLRVNITAEEVLRYSPKRVDVINLATRKFETMEVATLLREHGGEYPIVNQLVSLQASDGIRPPGRLAVNFEKAPPLITFDGLLGRTPFLRQVRAILDLLQEQLGYPVDIEFAHDGTDFYLLQCREQSRMREDTPVVIPEAASADKVIFTANRFVPNGRVSGITHIVYVDPQKYGELEDYQDLADVGRAIGELNKALPSRKFILMGPGRWGSRGDIKLGVSVTYADIDNTCMLIEIARKQQGYVPEPSFGTHFFQDLVEASIYYLPLYPDDSGVIFNESILTSQSNVLTQIVPGFEHLGHVLRVIDIPASTGGGTVQVLMNQDQEHAIALIRDSPGQR